MSALTKVFVVLHVVLTMLFVAATVVFVNRVEDVTAQQKKLQAEVVAAQRRAEFAEGQAQTDAFLQRLSPGAARLDPASPGHLLGLPDNGPARSVPSGDGFYYALLHKEPEPPR